MRFRPPRQDCFAVLRPRRPGCSFSLFVVSGVGGGVYLLYLDESGTHGGSPVFILAGLALHEQDTWFMQQRLDGLLKRKLAKGLNHLDFELHAADIKSPKGPVPGKRTRTSEWLGMPYGTRLDILNATYRSLAKFKCRDETYPCAFFGAVVDRSYADREERAYELVLHKFDETEPVKSNETARS